MPAPSPTSAPIARPSHVSVARASLAPAHCEQRWSQPPAPPAPVRAAFAERADSTLVVAARSARHSSAPPPIEESAARFLPFYWRLWLALTSR
jgi:hypothetical protein